MSGLTTFNIRCHNIIQNANLAIISHITKQKTKKSKNPQGKQSPKQVPCAAALPQPQPATQPAFHPASRSPHVPQLPPSPSHSSPPVPATTVPQSQPQLSPMLRCHRSHPASIPASEVPHATAPPWPQSAPSSPHHQARSPVPRQCRGPKSVAPKSPTKSPRKKKSQKICTVKKIAVILHRFSKKWRAHSSGCSSVRLEYASGGRGVASSNLVIPTEKKER